MPTLQKIFKAVERKRKALVFINKNPKSTVISISF